MLHNIYIGEEEIHEIVYIGSSTSAITRKSI